jgi:hypothetical protein
MEDDLDVLVKGLTRHVLWFLSRVDSSNTLLEIPGADSVEDGVDLGHGMGGSDGAGLKAGTTVGGGGQAIVAIGGDVDCCNVLFRNASRYVVRFVPE